ncbi:hypothetical protein [uncultured Polaribacter sp.]|uniref:hypothetical protein n=1 Tax=uncultured Polaribacter sp. TaxID=174711 RepID=UPI002603B726|nr:hypothetical protein [uncultured Polaribacter sp.]
MTKKLVHFISFSFLLFAVIRCDDSSKTSNTYFGGKIINPKTKFVVLHANDKIIDTLFLDERNKFFANYAEFDEGLYYFQHGNESQYIYLEPKDSLMLRLNTWDFDESLVFAGKGAERNNILVDIFLEDESDNKFYYQLNELAPRIYKKKIDSILDFKLGTYNDYIEKHPKETSSYFKILKVALTHPIYSRLERYPIQHVYALRKDNFPKIEASFYEYRSDIDYNNNSLMYYTPYTRYIRNYLYNTTYALGHKPIKNNFSSEFTVDLLKTINSKIDSEDSRNAFLKRTILDHFYEKSSCNVNLNTFDTFFELSTNEKDKDLIKDLLDNNKAIHKGDELKDFTISDFTNQVLDIEDFVINKNSVLLFWNEKYISKAFIGSRIAYLQKRYPSLNFAVIEIDGNNTNRIKNIDIKNQYFINSQKLKNNFLSSKLHRTVLVDQNGIVVNGYASLSSLKIYHQLKELSKNN